MSDQTAANTNTDNRQPPPMFYWRPVPLAASTHGWMKIRPEADFTFAARTNAVPLTAPEFVLAARHYPIIFVGDNLVPSIALGFRPDENLFVDGKGQWERLMYVPAYVRRYPFILLGNQGDTRLQLGIDDSAGTAADGARPLFEGEKETQVVRDALNLCEQFHQAYLFTQQFSDALKEKKLVEERSLDIQGQNQEKINVGSFFAVSEEKFRDLDDATANDWRKRGFLHVIYFHLQSLNNWETLFDRAGRRGQVPAAS
ncbi:MAG: SapC family protein [Rhodospirillaceae bacterium]|nr:SapC family protein [Rhodospirillaceae bacterium]